MSKPNFCRLHRNRLARPKARRGATLVEFAIVVPVIFTLFLGAIEMTRLNFIRHSASNAAYEGARKAIVPGSSISAVERAQLLLDADVANNAGNWQWVAGTGTDTKPYRRFNPVRQGHRFDPDGEYVRRYVPELAKIAGGAVHEPWLLPGDQRPAFGVVQ